MVNLSLGVLDSVVSVSFTVLSAVLVWVSAKAVSVSLELPSWIEHELVNVSWEIPSSFPSEGEPFGLGVGTTYLDVFRADVSP